MCVCARVRTIRLICARVLRCDGLQVRSCACARDLLNGVVGCSGLLEGHVAAQVPDLVLQVLLKGRHVPQEGRLKDNHHH